MKKKKKQDFCDRACELLEEVGEATVHELISMMRIRPSTGRVNADLPPTNSAVQYLRMDKRISGNYRKVRRTINNQTYNLMLYSLVGDDE
tara:strand:+ start:10726 stop:10995 length:270 start_codon:yes stop_codon:yes gene_type:complete